MQRKSTSGKSSNQFSASQSAASSSKPKEHGSSSEAKKKTKESSKLAIDGHGNTVINIYVNGENARLNFVLPDAIKKGLVGTEA
uniref:Uncharacterized protein n=1 Tax=Ditylenchus dipsaci TaxID=166011 RepID=A0A915DT02_9BILA